MKSRVSTVCAVMVGAFLLGDLGAAHAQPAHAAYVLNANDAGPGSFRAPTSLRNVGHGIDFDENRSSATDAGDLTARVSTSSSSNNGGAGVRADQQTPGVGTLTLAGVTLDGNGGGATAGTGVTVTTTP